MLQRRARKTPVQSHQAVFRQDRLDAMRSRLEPLVIPRIINQGSLDPLRRRDSCEGCYDAGGHAGEEITKWRKSSSLRVLEGILDGVEGQESNAILRNATDD